MDNTSDNALIKQQKIHQQKKELAAIYKHEISETLDSLEIPQKERNYLNTLVTEALDNMMPTEKVEENKVEENTVVCKLFLKGYPNSLLASLEPILKSLLARNNKTGNVDLERTNEYLLTLMIEKVKKP